ncbi:hypothetical protein D8B26_000536 [Coccidioides posadasii str. Silveira]|uniref:uncharacterized protein n=1 Tax=Coccidioides posadasii (strain RMSCC 757 / Silveira) TaxID=443226 RepID=UPI001BF02A10|nr:hypothetical protein D8B26_000536 [Coccidioides posadasii str. Silveira]
MPTVRETLPQALEEIIPIGDDAPGTTSLKADAAGYEPIIRYNFVPEAALESPALLGLEKQDDHLRLAQNYGESPTDVRHIVGNEGDTRRL